MSIQRERPSYYDGTQYVINVKLPPGKVTTADLYHHAYGVRLNDGAKPWPYYRDARSKEWWSLSTDGDAPVDALAWMIDLEQLAYKPRRDAHEFLEEVLLELAARAERFGGSAEPECSVSAALAKMDAATAMLKVRDYEVRIVVAAPETQSYAIAEWWQALENVGLEHGDGDLFWLYNATFTEGSPEPRELFCAEPYSVPGYFHPGDLQGPVRFPDVALHFRARDFADPTAVLRYMAKIAKQLAKTLGAALLTHNGQPFDLAVADSELKQGMKELRSLRNAT
jgi:hypothetical protein